MALGWAIAGLGLVGAMGYVRHCAWRHEARADAAYPPEGQIIDVDGHAVHVVVMGPTDAPDLVLIHGSSGNTRDFTHALAPALAMHYRVYVIDRPGLGYTERINRRGASLREQAELLSATARQLGAHRPIVLGQSYGGAVALAWAVHNPNDISALVLLSAASQPWTTGLGWYYTLLSNRLLGPVIIPLLTAFVHDERVERELEAIFAPQSPPSGYQDHIGAGLTLRRASLRANALQRANLLSEITALHPLYPDIAIPVESLHGTADTTVGLRVHAEPLADQIESNRLTLLEGVGHMPHHTSRPEVIAAVHRVADRAGLPSSLLPTDEIS
ncbi:alpha/beta hydrolase [Alisedimentitalea sp. MJ-SS2]|uniref:alpha/beta fold hydrolase n=1 Tax=Aliisedimentitalea sp. MJ-SS2 TaxID=3049795 RepID=UPI002908CECE|nr:alpha/beta hydrolase [Alisedimentitalea sp. MJ-SS2]MDU8926868.1 alpha/beta hydrolase [Alisedimentitalea sp. MJ-SS2]